MDGSHGVWRAQLSAPFPEPPRSGAHFVPLQEKSEFLGLFVFASLKNEEAGRDGSSQGPGHISALCNDGQAQDRCCRVGS